MKPLIGISPSPSSDAASHGTFYRYCLSRTYTDSVIAVGGIPIILPTANALEDILPRLDGLLLSGGGDIDPVLFGDSTVHETTYGIDDERDSFEIGAFNWALAHDLPTLCICRGIQVMNVALGGTLIQDIPTQIEGALEHRQQALGKMRDETSHTVTIAGSNPLRDLVGEDTMLVNSFHHQSVGKVADALATIATADDGVVEGLWHPGMRFGLGVQWHPEMLASTNPSHAAIFSSFVSASSNVPSVR